jgi:hypothetical protein
MEDQRALEAIRKRLDVIEAYLDHQSTGWRGFGELAIDQQSLQD